jgi:hypothetical protein
MTDKIKIDDTEYDLDNVSDQAKAMLQSLKFASRRLEELVNMQVLLRRAKSSYIKSLKQEMLAQKSGLNFGDE